MIPLCVPNIAGNEWRYVKECFDTGWVSSAGPFVDRFEREFTVAVGARNAVAVASGTAALHVALRLAGVEPEDEVILPTLTFIAPANAVRYLGGWPVFLDVDPEYWQLDPGELVTFLEEDCEATACGPRNRRTGRTIKAVIPVDILGHPCELDSIREAAERFGIAVVEDATESLGATYKGSRLGHVSGVTCFSFNGNKLLTTGGGGMLTCEDDTLARRARYLTTQAKDDPVEFVHREVGYNYRLTNVQAAMGCAQLERLDDFVAMKRAIAHRYNEGLKGCAGIRPMVEAPWGRSAFWMYTVRVETGAGVSSRELMHSLANAGIQSRPLWQPLHLSPAHTGSYARPCPVAESVHCQALSLPCSTGLSVQDQQRVVLELKRSLANSQRSGSVSSASR